MTEIFTGNFTQQEPIPQAGIRAANAVMEHGRLHRYNVGPGEISETVALEEEFAAFLGAKYCLATSSGGAAIATALRATGVTAGTPVLTNAFTLAPVPGAIAAISAKPVFVETTAALTMDAEDLAAKAAASGAKHLLLSHMRGHQPNMEQTMALAETLGLTVIEDCAHTMGGMSCGLPSGRHGHVAAFSTQTYKHINSGEGGFLTTDDAEIAARSILLSGSYMLYERHAAAPPAEVFEALRDVTPNVSGRMDNLRAAVLRPQLRELPDRVRRWAVLHDAVEDGLKDNPDITLIPRDPSLVRVGSSFQMCLFDWPPERIERLVSGCLARGVELKWFGAPRAQGYTSRYSHWRYAGSARLSATDRILDGLIDMRLPLTFDEADARLIARIISEEVKKLASVPA